MFLYFWFIIFLIVTLLTGSYHCMKSVQIRSFFWSVFFRTRTEYGPEKTPYLDTFHAVYPIFILSENFRKQKGLSFCSFQDIFVLVLIHKQKLQSREQKKKKKKKKRKEKERETSRIFFLLRHSGNNYFLW